MAAYLGLLEGGFSWEQGYGLLAIFDSSWVDPVSSATAKAALKGLSRYPLSGTL